MAKLMEIVVGLDGSPSSWRAFWFTLGMAARERAFIHVCFVLHLPAGSPAGPFVQPVPDLVPDDDGGELEPRANEEREAAGVEGKFTCAAGDVAGELEGLAERRHADLLVLGRSPHPALHLGGVPRRLLTMGRRPVLVVP